MPTAALVTSTAMVQLAWPAARLPPAKVMVLLATTAVTVPLHCVATGAEATTSPRGSVSVNASGCWFGLPAPLVIVKVRVDGVLTMAGEGPMALVRVGPITFSVSFTLATSPPARAVMLALALL